MNAAEDSTVCRSYASTYDDAMGKTRVTVTIDDKLIAAAREAAGEGSLSAWVADAIAEKVRKTSRLAALKEAVEYYEAEFGPLTDEEMEAVAEHDRTHAIHVRPRTTEASGAA